MFFFFLQLRSTFYNSFVVLGIRETKLVNNILPSLNLLVLLFFIKMAFVLADWSNWSNAFLPYGVSSIFVGASREYYLFTGHNNRERGGQKSIVISPRCAYFHRPFRDRSDVTVGHHQMDFFFGFYPASTAQFKYP